MPCSLSHMYSRDSSRAGGSSTTVDERVEQQKQPPSSSPLFIPILPQEEEEEEDTPERESPYIAFDKYHRENKSSDSQSEEQRFFPSFPYHFSPLGGLGVGGRVPLFPGPASNTLPSSPSRYHINSHRGGPSSAPSHLDNNVLGSGNFEVVRGGTYYADEDSYNNPHYEEDGGGYYNNGHSSPYRGTGGDFFANFRDFADINPHSRSYSTQSEVRAVPRSSSQELLMSTD